MVSGRGHSVINETFTFLRYDEGYKKEDKEMLEEFAYDWAFYDMTGRDKMRFTSGFEIVKKLPEEWIRKELDRLKEERINIAEQRYLLLKELDVIGSEIKIDINDIAQLAQETYNLKQSPTSTWIKYRPPKGETQNLVAGIGSTLAVYFKE